MRLQWTFVIAYVGLAVLAENQGFLKDGGSSAVQDVDTLLADSVKQIGAEKTENRLAEVKEILRPMYTALPKAMQNKPSVTSKVARYALHRYFEHRYGWFLRGLGTAGHSYDNSTDEQKATATLHAFLDKSDEGPDGGVSLHTLAAIAITLEEIIFKDIREQIKQSYMNIDLLPDLVANPDLEIDRNTVDRLILSYMISFMSGADEFNVTEQVILRYREFMVKNSRGWLDTEDWMRRTYAEVMPALGYSEDVNAFHFLDAERIIKEMIWLYSDYNEGECQKVKSILLTMEDRHTGRLSLADFYRLGLSETWQFNEKAEYLRDLGALDESRHRQPRVIVANYLSSWANCMNTPKHYAICCRDQCEWVMDQLERQIQAPTAIPSEIMLFVEHGGLKGNTTLLSNLTLLEERLGHIAARHDGQVPLHGRLFAQWLHHAAPQECPYPHESGTINPQSPSEYMQEKGLNDLKATEQEIMNYVSVGVNGYMGSGGHKVHSEDHTENDVPWSDVEELMVVRTVEPRAPRLQTGVFSDYIVLLFEVIAVCMLFAATLHISKSKFYRMRLKRARYSDKVFDA